MRLFFIFILIISLFGRENPFEPVINPQIPIKQVKPEYFKTLKIFFPRDARVLKKIILVYQNLNGDIKKKEIIINKNIDFHYPIKITHTISKILLKEIDFDSLFKLFIKGKKIFLETKDKFIRSIFLVQPFRLVLDFKKDTSFLTIRREINSGVVKKVVVGNHEGFYRVVLYFDANYEYKIIPVDEGVKIELY
jgi:hypothetical protein